MADLRVFIAKHGCDDQPWIQGTDPDPRSGDPMFSFDGPDYSGWYVRERSAPPLDIKSAAKVIRAHIDGRSVFPNDNGYEALADAAVHAALGGRDER